MTSDLCRDFTWLLHFFGTFLFCAPFPSKRKFVRDVPPDGNTRLTVISRGSFPNLVRESIPKRKDAHNTKWLSCSVVFLLTVKNLLFLKLGPKKINFFFFFFFLRMEKGEGWTTIYIRYFSYFSYNNASKLISSAAQGKVRSNLVTTSGCTTPSLPITWPYMTTSAQRPGKKLESETEKVSFVSTSQQIYATNNVFSQLSLQLWTTDVSLTLCFADVIPLVVLRVENFCQLHDSVQHATDHLKSRRLVVVDHADVTMISRADICETKSGKRFVSLAQNTLMTEHQAHNQFSLKTSTLSQRWGRDPPPAHNDDTYGTWLFQPGAAKKMCSHTFVFVLNNNIRDFKQSERYWHLPVAGNRLQDPGQQTGPGNLVEAKGEHWSSKKEILQISAKRKSSSCPQAIDGESDLEF